MYGMRQCRRVFYRTSVEFCSSSCKPCLHSERLVVERLLSAVMLCEQARACKQCSSIQSHRRGQPQNGGRAYPRMKRWIQWTPRSLTRNCPSCIGKLHLKADRRRPASQHSHLIKLTSDAAPTCARAQTREIRGNKLMPYQLGHPTCLTSRELFLNHFIRSHFSNASDPVTQSTHDVANGVKGRL